MKSTNPHISDTERIRRLLELYYEGETDKAQEDELIEYFTSTVDVAPEFAADAAIFRAVADAHRVAVNIPEDLEGRIVAATVDNRRQPRFARFYRVASIAAVFALMVGVGLRLGREDARQVQSTPVHTPSELVAAAQSVEPLPEDSVAEPMQKAERKIAAVSRRKKAAPANGYHVVTDTAQAAEIADRVLALLDASLETGARGVKRADVAFVNLDKTLERICGGE